MAQINLFADTLPIAVDDVFATPINVAIPAMDLLENDEGLDNGPIAVIVQEPNHGRVLGAAQLK